MSDLQDLNILLKPNSNKNNKKLLTFLHDQQKKINDNNIIIKPIIVESDKINEFVKIGVNNLPSLLYKGEVVYGVKEIIKFIDKLCINTIKKSNNIKIDDDDDIKSYMLNMAMEDDGDESNIENPVSDKELRNNRFTNHNAPQIPTMTKKNNYIKNINNNSKTNHNNYNNSSYSTKVSEDEEDQIMSKYWQNSEETDI